HEEHSLTTTANEYCESVNNGIIKEDTMKGSPHRTAMLTVHGTHVHIEYSSPGVKGRIVWGGLVSYDKVWVTGAHQATRVRFYNDVIVNTDTISKGTYALFTIPGETEWTVILNKNYDQHLTDEYDQKEDVLRLIVRPETHHFTPRLTYGIEELEGQGGVINILWDKMKIDFPFKVTGS
ncbi:MAG TPA: DUF2911 domain-containing protein, partial [Chitinophagaceae bacterium]|nr:DUF2911 domain-containing protein [Chitinophagaceae bacterium]